MGNKYYTLWIAAVCVVMFILQSIIPALTESLLLDSSFKLEIWRYVTAIFLHGSFLHLILNMFALLLFGLVLESLIGSRKFLIVFLSSGIIANIISVFFYPSSLGASGAIFGVLGTLVIIKPLMMVFVSGIPMPMFIAAIVWVLIDLWGLVNPSDIGNIAHLSGIAIGLVLGIYYRLRYFGKEETRGGYSRDGVHIPEEHMRMWEDRFMR